MISRSELHSHLKSLTTLKNKLKVFWAIQKTFSINFPQWNTQALSFGTTFSPDYLRRDISRWVSCYAFFQWWLLLSQHPHCQRDITSLSALNVNLGTLTWDLGSFPLDQWSLAPTVLLPYCNPWYSEFDRTNEISPYLVLPVLYPQGDHTTLSQKIFRREPAITRFD